MSAAEVRDPGEPEESAIALRALAFSQLPNAGSDQENWERGRQEILDERRLIAARATQIAISARAGTSEENWLLAEQELDIELKMRRAHRTKWAWFQGSRRAEDLKQQRIAARAEEIGTTWPGSSDSDIHREAEASASGRMLVTRDDAQASLARAAGVAVRA